MTSARYRVEPLPAPFDVELELPGSKSITNRAVLCAALAEGTSELTGVLFADDTEAMLAAVERLGADVEADRDAHRVRITGIAGKVPPGPVDLDARASGTTARFLLAAVASGSGPYTITGDRSLRARPMGEGLAVLRAVGARIDGEERLPVTVRGPVTGDAPVRVRGDVSSQFLSGVLLAAPTWPGGRRIVVEGPLVSRPYVTMTVAVMRSFGASVEERGDGEWVVAGGGYRAGDHAIEPDASAASYFFAAAAITGSRVRVPGLGATSLQGDLAFAGVLGEMGADVEIGPDATTVAGTGRLHGVTADLRAFSDTAQTLAVTAVFADSPTTLTGIGFIRGKETDRVGAVVRELSRLGIGAVEEPDGLTVHPGTPRPGIVHTYEDHRMAMSFALLGLRAPGIEIDDPDCVAKTFPDFFDVLGRLYA